MKRLILYFLMLFSVAAQAAENKWFMVATTEDSSTLNILMSRIGFLLLSDDSDAFSVVCKDGNVYNDVISASFSQLDPETAGISSVVASDEVVLSLSATKLTLSGIKDGEKAVVYSVGGAELQTKVLSTNDNTISIGSLPAGVYILKTSKASVKFSKR